MTTVMASTQLDRDNPWPGLEAFDESGRDYFHGRDHEAAELLNHVLDAAVTVLYARSGLGKTSLLQAGVFPLLRDGDLRAGLLSVLRDRDFLPVYVRFELKPGAAPLAQPDTVNPFTTRFALRRPTRCCPPMRNRCGNTCIAPTWSYGARGTTR